MCICFCLLCMLHPVVVLYECLKFANLVFPANFGPDQEQYIHFGTFLFFTMFHPYKLCESFLLKGVGLLIPCLICPYHKFWTVAPQEGLKDLFFFFFLKWLVCFIVTKGPSKSTYRPDIGR